jgi:hypothetical protein
MNGKLNNNLSYYKQDYKYYLIQRSFKPCLIV